MKNLTFPLLLFLAISCTSARQRKTVTDWRYIPEKDYDHFYHSRTAENVTRQMRDAGVLPRPALASLNGMIFTCQCPPAYIDTSYRKKFPDVTLIAKIPKGEADRAIQIHY